MSLQGGSEAALDDCKDDCRPVTNLQIEPIQLSEHKEANQQKLHDMAVKVAEEDDHTPMNLLELPIDLLEVIVREIGSTNDLTSLALTHSVLHAIAIPQMYSRFDIVWPEPEDDTDVRNGVDALAFGLGTLAMSGSLLGPMLHSPSKCDKCGHIPPSSDSFRAAHHMSRRRINNYAQFTRHFSIGNGSLKFVRSYYISTESGKMLGTLVALAVSRMRNLESFVWDMPTGIIRETWEALATLAHSLYGPASLGKLDTIWIRCHDSKLVRAPSQNLHFFHSADTLSARYELLRESFRQIEHPNFSILPSLRSISVLQIDQIAYFEELSILILNSLSRLRELRIGVSKLSELSKEHVRESPGDPDGTYLGESSLTPLGANGVLGMLMSKLCECARQRVIVPDQLEISGATQPQVSERDISNGASVLAHALTDVPCIVPGVILEPSLAPSEVLSLGQPGNNLYEGKFPTLRPAAASINCTLPSPKKSAIARKDEEELGTEKIAEADNAKTPTKRPDKHLEKSKTPRELKLHLLALENVPLSVSVLTRALNWHHLNDITLLNCNSDEKLWKALGKAFPPQLKSNVDPSAAKTASSYEFPLRLKRLHTDGVSTALLSFLRDNLAPNTLQCLFLQNRKDYKPSSKVSIDMIYKGPLRRHRESIQKLSIDSAFKTDSIGVSWKAWLANRDVLTFITSGKMANLRELAISVGYRDWHFFLQHLPGLPHLRSLYVPGISEHVHAVRLDAQELAFQILDIVTLRPEIELCYIGILTKCFQILEGKNIDRAAAAAGVETNGDFPVATVPNPTWGGFPLLNHEDSETSSAVSVSDDDDDEDDNNAGPVVWDDEEEPEETHESESDSDESHVSEASEDSGPKAPRLRLREILFFAEKVEIFKIRYGTL